MQHELKILPPFFQAVIEGRKTFEIRADTDRGFQAGDSVLLREFAPAHGVVDSQHYTGRAHEAAIGYVTAYEQKPGFVVFSLVPNAQAERRQ
jgi:hypothetical protein